MVDLENRLTKVNDNILKAMGVANEAEIVGHNFYDFIHPGDWDETRTNTAKTVREGRIGQPRDVRIVRPDGTRWIMEFVNVLIRDDAGKAKGICG